MLPSGKETNSKKTISGGFKPIISRIFESWAA